MARVGKPRIFLDTHVLIWLHEGRKSIFKNKTKTLIQSSLGRIYISPMVSLELQYLSEKDKLLFSVKTILSEVEELTGLVISQTDFSEIVEVAQRVDWTRDTFDRIIVAEAMLHNAPLVTKDKTIRKYYPLAVW